MSLLSRLNKPITLSRFPDNYVTNSRPINDEEVILLKQEIDLLKKSNEINWRLPGTYIPSLLFSLIIILIYKKFIIAVVSFIVSFTVSKLMPFFLKGDSKLLKKDIAGGVTCVKSGPVTIIEDNYGNTYMKRSYLDDVIIDGIYAQGDALKYPHLTDGQNIEVTYSPNAQYIFLVRSL